jgi:large subunit ribosomal protein L7Ae
MVLQIIEKYFVSYSSMPAKEKKDEQKPTKKAEKPKVKVAKKAEAKAVVKPTAKPAEKKQTKPTPTAPVAKKKVQPTEKVSRKTPAAFPGGAKKKVAVPRGKAEKRQKDIHIVARPRIFSIGGHLPPKRDLSRMVKWPKYIQLQRKRKVMYDRLKIPAMINQFTQILEKQKAKQIFQFVKKYRPETKHQKKHRLLSLARQKTEGKTITQEKPFIVKFGVNHVASLVEQKKAQLVIIANDVTPIEHVLWLPTLCRKMDVPYCIVKNKARLGTAVHMKTATCLAFVSVRDEDKKTLNTLTTMCKENYNERADQIVKHVGGGKLGLRSSVALKKRADALKKASLEKQQS